MPRRATPWRRGGPKGPWYAHVGGLKTWLAPATASKTEAQNALDDIRREARPGQPARPSAGLNFRDCVNLFLAAGDRAVERGEKKPVTLEGYRRFLFPADLAFGRQAVASLKPFHITAWLDGESWNTTTRNNAITAVKACLNWAKKQGHIPENPVADMEKPRPRVTETDLTSGQAAAIIAGAKDQAFRDFMAVAFATGARPSELMAVESRHCDFKAGVIVMPGKTTGETGRVRVIQLGPAAETLARLAGVNPDGPLLRNAKGTAWTRHTLAHRFGRLRVRLGLGKEATAKAFRHGFATDGLENGVPTATMAELMGHTSEAMVTRHYSKIRKRMEHLKAEAAKFRPDPAEDGD